MAPARRKLFLLGAGALGSAVLDSLSAYPVLTQTFEAVLVIDKRVPAFASLGGFLPENCSFKQFTITPENVEELFNEVLGVSQGDMVLDLLVNCDPVPLLEACMERDAHYLNAATDVWLGKAGIDSLAREQEKMMKVQDKYNNRPGGAPTAFLEQGMNPGMVNAFAIKALAEAAEASGIPWPQAEQFTLEDGTCNKKAMLAARAEVARRLGLTSIHSTDIDYHLSGNYEHGNKVMASTWGPTSFWEECVLAAEWHAGSVGVAEASTTSRHSLLTDGKGSGAAKSATLTPTFDATSQGLSASAPGRQAFSTWVKSYSGPEGYYNGMVVPHGENFSLGRSLTVWSTAPSPAGEGATGNGTSASGGIGMSAAPQQQREAVWSPEVAFIYRPNNIMLESCFIHGCDGNARMEDITPYVLHTEEDQLEGQETVGVLLRFDDEGGACKYRWSWCGNTLGYTNPDLTHRIHNATILQVAGSVLSAVQYMMAYPREGICWPEEAAHTEFIVGKSLTLLGRVDIMHSSEPLTDMPRLLTSPGTVVQLDLAAELERGVKAVRGNRDAAVSDAACRDQGAASGTACSYRLGPGLFQASITAH